MNDNCQLVVFSNKAYNAIIRESFNKHPVETGGILLGHILDNGIWIVMEAIPPGLNCVFQHAYFEYDDVFINYLADSIANEYKYPLQLLGLWHRHPGSLDKFSRTDDVTNFKFARLNTLGAISGLVNIDPRFRLSIYHINNEPTRNDYIGTFEYDRIDIEVGDDVIPKEYFQLRYYDGFELNPLPQITNDSSDQREFPLQEERFRQNTGNHDNNILAHKYYDEIKKNINNNKQAIYLLAIIVSSIMFFFAGVMVSRNINNRKTTQTTKRIEKAYKSKIKEKNNTNNTLIDKESNTTQQLDTI